ncbi:MAG TPA: TorF family putative porin [Usitatibacter sp.]|nr:TorF family putative porin [Usitatibacter sp.]
MTKLPQHLLLAGVLAAGAAHAQTAPAPAPPAEPPPAVHTFTGKAALYSEYEYRGISQTSEKPALQLNLDYAHASGFYLGTFITNIKWLKDSADVGGFSTKAKIEWDIYGGFKKEIAKDLTLDVGYLRYEYPQSKEFHPKPNTDEIYAGLTWTVLNVKYSHSLGDTFGFANSKGSTFIEANLAYPLMEGKLTLTGHVGHQKFKNNDDFSYTVWKAGAVYDLGGGWNVGGYVKGTDAKSDLYTYKGKDWSKDRLVAFVTYSF